MINSSIEAYKKKRLNEEQVKHEGHFVPMDARKEVAQELKRTHFVLGNDKGILH